MYQAVLETIRALMNAECVVPDWLHDTFLGYGDPAAAHYTRCMYIHVQYTSKKLPINGPFNGPPVPVPFPFNVRSTSVQCPFVARLIPVHF